MELIKEIELKELNIESVTLILKAFRPSWDLSRVQMKTFSEGHINAIAGFYLDALNEESVIIRVNGISYGNIHRDREMKYHKLLKEAKITDYLLGVFKNGIVMSYIPGKSLTHCDNLTPIIEEKISRKLANLHSRVPVSEDFYYDGVADNDHVLSNYVKEYLTMVQNLPSHNEQLEKAGCPSVNCIIEVLQDNMDQIDLLMKLQKTPVKTIHGDSHLGNFMFCHESNTLTMIDFEIMRPFPVAYDLAYHFVYYASIENTDSNKIPSREDQTKWLKVYFDELGETGDAQHKLINDYLDSIELMVPIAILTGVLAGCVLAQNTQKHQDGYDYVGYTARMYAFLKKYLEATSQKYKDFNISFK